MMADIVLVAADKDAKTRIEMIGKLNDRAERLLATPVRDLEAIETLAIEMREIGLIKASRILLDAVGL